MTVFEFKEGFWAIADGVPQMGPNQDQWNKVVRLVHKLEDNLPPRGNVSDINDQPNIVSPVGPVSPEPNPVSPTPVQRVKKK